MWKFILRPLVRPVLRDGESEVEEQRKWLVVGCIWVTLAVEFIVRGLKLLFRGVFTPYHFFTPVQIIFLIYIYKTKTVPQKAAKVWLLSLCVQYLLSDIMTGGEMDFWVVTIVILDVLLLLQFGGLLFIGFRAVIVLYLALKSLEDAYEFGLYFYVDEGLLRRCDPISSSVAFGLFLIRAACFLIDFNITRTFSHGLFTERERMQRTIDMAERIAQCFVLFDLEQAEAVLEERSDDGPLRDAYRKLLENLQEYRPFLPDSLFATNSSSTSHSQRPLDSPRAFVFTDIQSSTTLWETYQGSMKRALEIHNTIMRECVAATRGYEVKTIGDSFMVAFEGPEDACEFCLRAQEELYQCDRWPKEMLTHPLCEANGMWSGLRVRMGVHVGEADMEVNPVTGRADYFGPTINTAARVEGMAKGGTIVVTDAVLAALNSSELPDHSVVPYQTAHLRGVKEPMQLYYLLPTRFLSRLDDLSELNVNKIPSQMMESSVSSVSSLAFSALRHRLQVVSATVGHIRVEYPVGVRDLLDLTSEVLASAFDCVARTDGSTIAVCSMGIVLGWNTSRVCSMHILQSARFAGLFYKASLGTSWHPKTHIGLASGDVYSGNVGTSGQRFATVIGTCVEFAGWLAGAAADLPTFTFVAGTGVAMCAAHDTTLVPFTRKVARVDITDSPVDVYELRVADVLEVYHIPDEWGYSDAYRQCVAAGDYATVLQHSKSEPSLSRIVGLLKGATALRSVPPKLHLS
eukprot:Sspe_Gene.73438::Locus_44330_Transcript_1_1_Confidence_1.000_Length_2349::g.73438::m.73438